MGSRDEQPTQLSGGKELGASVDHKHSGDVGLVEMDSLLYYHFACWVREVPVGLPFNCIFQITPAMSLQGLPLFTQHKSLLTPH